MANDSNKYVGPRGICCHEGSSRFQTTSCSGWSGIRAWPKRKKTGILVLHLIPERWIVSVFAELISRPLSTAGYARGCWMMQSWCYPRRKFHFPIFTLERLWTVPAAWDWRFFLGMMHLSHTPFPLYRPKLATTQQHEAFWKEKFLLWSFWGKTCWDMCWGGVVRSRSASPASAALVQEGKALCFSLDQYTC